MDVQNISAAYAGPHGMPEQAMQYLVTSTLSSDLLNFGVWCSTLGKLLGIDTMYCRVRT
jgi:hypothetical protein